MQAVMAKTNEVCLRYLDNSMLCSLPPPSNTYYETSVFAMRNKRRTMEDRHVSIHDLNTMFNNQEASPSSYYAIFDGHAGHDAAEYSAAHLHQFLAENINFVSNPEKALLDAFCKTDAFFSEKCKVENLNGGTTAVVALLRPKEKCLYIAWVGDSQALLVNQGKILQCVNPHKPCREDERERIEKAGGCVMLWGTWRVNGQLAVSRAIGDVEYKPHVIAIPDVTKISLDGGEDFFILACDGLWDYLSEDAAAQEVYYMIAENPDQIKSPFATALSVRCSISIKTNPMIREAYDIERVSKHLVYLARYQGSTDNISVIVVFLREPHQIAAEAHRWASTTGQTLTKSNMEAGLDNANNPFTNSNGSLKNLDDAENINLQKTSEGLLLNLTENFKTNGTDHSKDIFVTETSKGTKKSTSDLHFDDDFGPETDVDAVDDALSPMEKEKAFSESLSKAMNAENVPKSFNDEVKAFADGLINNNPMEDAFNSFLNSDRNEKSTESSKEIDFEEFRERNRDETPTPPADTVNDVGGLDVNPAESDSEDEWNYIKGDQAKPENISFQPETVVEISEQDDAMSQLNPDAAEFVPVSPTRSIPSPACRTLLNDEVISQSPKRPLRVDISVPSEIEFESEVKSRPSDVECKNGHGTDNEHISSGSEQIEQILNGKNIDEIPEFHPGSTPSKLATEEFHFGPNAAPFTPRALDQSEAFSTKANFGDDTEQTLNTSFNDSESAAPNKDKTDTMSTSFYAEKGESNPFQEDDDLNKVHKLPENLDAFLQDVKENIGFDYTLSDLQEHYPLGRSLDNDQAAVQTTDLDKISQDDEKELASPLGDRDFLEVDPIASVLSSDLPEKSPELNLLRDFVVNEKPLSDDSNIASLPELEPIYSPVSEPPPTISPVQLEPNELVSSPAPLNIGSMVPEGDLLEAELQLPKQMSSPTFEEPKQHLLEKQEQFHLDINQFSHGEGALESQSPVNEFSIETKSPIESSGSELKAVSEAMDLEFNPKSEIESVHPETKQPSVLEGGLSPIPACEYSTDPESCNFGPEDAAIREPHSPIDLYHEQIQNEEVTSSVKDDISISSPIDLLSPSKSPESLVDEVAKPVGLSSDPVESFEDVSKLEPKLSYVSCPEPEPLLPTQVEVTDINSLKFLPDALELTSHTENKGIGVNAFEAFKPSAPLESLLESHPSVELAFESKDVNISEPSAPLEPSSHTALSNGLYDVASRFNEQICIKTDNITPEFAEPAVITPEESKVIDEIVTPSHVTGPTNVTVIRPGEPHVPELEAHTELKSQEQPMEVPVETSKDIPLTTLPVISVAPLETKEAKAEEKKSSASVLGKKMTGKVEPKKPLISPRLTAAKPSSKPALSSPKTGVLTKVPSKPGTTKPTTTAPLLKTTSTTTSKPLPKPKTAITSKTTERKPIPHAEVKPAPRTIAKKLSTEVAPKTISRPATTVTKTSPGKTTVPRPTTVPKTSAPKTTSTMPLKPTAAAKPKVPLTHRTTTTAAVSKSSTTTSAKTTSAGTQRLSPKPAVAPPKPRTITSTAPKPRVPLTKTVAKSADVEKEKKENANKLTASRNTTVTRTTTAGRTTTTKKVETKLLSDRTAGSRTTSSTAKTTGHLKPPGEIKITSKTKTTKVEKPKQNGIAPTSVTEEIKEITIVNNVVNESNPENLVKDNSPLDNKLIIETSNGLIDMNPAD